MNRPIKNPETEAVAQHIARSIASENRAGYAFGLRRLDLLNLARWEILAIQDRVHTLVKGL